MQQVLIINPHYMTAFLNLGLIHSARGAYDDAATAFRRARTYAPGFADLLALLSFAEARAGRLAEARVLGTELRRLESNTYVSGYVRALHHLGLGERDEALSNLERAYDDRSWLVAMLKVDPLLDELRPDPRFQALALRLKFPE
jgi:tetratricopeptide (TPR) repeat protein